jgi:hypothetical protein
MEWIVSVALPALAGVFLGSYMSGRRETMQRRSAFVERQLRELYSPLLRLREEIRTQSELGVTVQATADAVWSRLSAEAHAQRVGIQYLKETRWPEFERVIEYDNTKLKDHLMPAYRKMVAVFRDNFWLAETALPAGTAFGP